MMSRRRASFALALGLLPVGVACASDKDPGDPVRPALELGDSGAGVLGAGGSMNNPGAGGVVGNGGVVGSGGFVGSGGSVGTAGVAGSGGRSASSGGSAGASSGGATGSSGGSGSGGLAGDGGAAPPGTLLFFDDFEGAPKGWVSIPMTDWSVIQDGTNVLKQGTLDSLSSYRLSSAGDVGWTDQIVEAKVKVLAFTGQSTSYLAGVFARVKDLQNAYFVALQSDGSLKIKKISSGSNSSISSSAKVTITTNTWYAIKLSVIGSTLTGYLDGVQVVTATDTDIAAGGVAVGTKNATAEFDDVRVTAP